MGNASGLPDLEIGGGRRRMSRAMAQSAMSKKYVSQPRNS